MTVHRFVHIGDLHLGSNSRNADRRAALDQIIREQAPGASGSLSAWLIPGDLNHGRMTIEDRNWLAERVIQMANVAPVVICDGNHDLPGDLCVLEKLHAVWPIYVVSRPQVLTVPLGTGGVAAIYVLPYPTRAGLIAAGVPSEQVVDAARQALDVMFMAAAAELQQKVSEGCMSLMIGHCNVAGSIASSGQPNIGKEIEVDAALLQRFGHIPILLNHIHKGQSIGGAHYAGSVCRLDYGEIEPKRYLVVIYENTSNALRRNDWTWAIEEKPLDVAPMYRISGELTRDGFLWEVVRGPGDPSDPPPPSFEGAEVKVSYRFSAEEKPLLDFSLVEQPFIGAKRFEPDPIAVRSRAIRAPEVAAAVTLEQKAEAFVKQSNLPWTPGLEAKIALLQQAGDGGAFLTEVQRGLLGVVPDGPVLRGQSVQQTPGARAVTDNVMTVDVIDLNQIYPIQKALVQR